MAWFCHATWARIKADLDLRPMPPHARDVIDQLRAGECFSLDDHQSGHDTSVLAVVRRLDELELLEEEHTGWDMPSTELYAGDMLDAIVVRGLIGELVGAANP